MAVLPSSRSVCLHEAFHTASLILDGQVPLAVTVDVWSGATDGLLGLVKPDWESHDFTPSTMRAQLISVLLGSLSDGEPQIDAVHWPISADAWRSGNTHDASQAAFLAEWLGLDQVGWGAIVHKAQTRARDGRFRRLVVEIAQALEDKGELYKPELIAIAERVK